MVGCFRSRCERTVISKVRLTENEFECGPQNDANSGTFPEVAHTSCRCISSLTSPSLCVIVRRGVLRQFYFLQCARKQSATFGVSLLDPEFLVCRPLIERSLFGSREESHEDKIRETPQNILRTMTIRVSPTAQPILPTFRMVRL